MRKVPEKMRWKVWRNNKKWICKTFCR